MIRRVLTLAVAAVLAGCTAAAQPVTGEGPALELPVAVDTQAAPEPEPSGRPSLLPAGQDVLATPLERVVRMWQHPREERAAFALRTRNPLGNRVPMLIAEARRWAGRAWYRVYLPLRPNGSTAWVRARDVDLRPIHHRIEVDLSDRVLRYYVRGELVERLSVGVGTQSTPTGVGTFYVWVKVHYASPFQPYGIAALGLSGFSPVLSEWPGGGRMAIHGTSSPTDLGRAVSHGCVRVLNDDLRSLLDVPLGTPVEITR